jgi:hypothetical protein
MFLRKNGLIDIDDLACDKDGLTATTSAINKLKKGYLKKIIDKFRHNDEDEADKEDRKQNEK